MKLKATRTDVECSIAPIYQTGYCELAHLLRDTNAIAYNCGVYGWNYDVYDIENAKTGEAMRICTGYRGMIGKRIDNKIARKYESKARAIWENWELTYEQKRKKAQQLRNKFITEVIRG